jgi:hypothetical protein
MSVIASFQSPAPEERRAALPFDMGRLRQNMLWY